MRANGSRLQAAPANKRVNLTRCAFFVAFTPAFDGGSCEGWDRGLIYEEMAGGYQRANESGGKNCSEICYIHANLISAEKIPL